MQGNAPLVTSANVSSSLHRAAVMRYILQYSVCIEPIVYTPGGIWWDCLRGFYTFSTREDKGKISWFLLYREGTVARKPLHVIPTLCEVLCRMACRHWLFSDVQGSC